MASINTASSTSSSWLTTFYYEQDLRSTHMNQILNATLKPGIYNANFALVMQTSDEASTSAENNISSANAGLYLFVKKGSTFVFSNSYGDVHNEKGEVSKPYEKDLSGVGSYLIKSVAEKDMFIPLATVSQSGSSTETTKLILGRQGDAGMAVTSMNDFYIAAKIVYYPVQDSAIHHPEFVCLRKNDDYDPDSGESLSNEDVYYLEVGVDNIGESSNPIVDGTKKYDLVEKNSNQQLSWLNVGLVHNTLDGVCVMDGSGNISYDSAKAYLERYVFIGRGLPEYRNTYLADQKSLKSSLITSPDCNKIYIDIPNTIVGSTIISKETDYQAIHNIGGKAADNYTAITSFSAPSFKEETEDNLFVDVTFLSYTENCNYSENNRSNILEETPCKFITYSFSTETSKNVFDPCYDNEGDNTEWENDSTGNVYKGHKYFSTNPNTLANEIIIPLDVSAANQQRLLDVIKNTNFIPKVVDLMRSDNVITADSGDKLIPLFAAFRKRVSADSYADKVSNDSRVHPANILSFLDLDNGMSKLSSMNISNNVFNIISILSDN